MSPLALAERRREARFDKIRGELGLERGHGEAAGQLAGQRSVDGRRVTLRSTTFGRGSQRNLHDDFTELSAGLRENINVGLVTLDRAKSYYLNAPSALATVHRLAQRPAVAEGLGELRQSGWDIHLTNRAIGARKKGLAHTAQDLEWALVRLAVLAEAVERERTLLAPGALPNTPTHPPRPVDEVDDAEALRPLAEACGLDVESPPVRMVGQRDQHQFRVQLEAGEIESAHHPRGELYTVVTVVLPAPVAGAFLCARSGFRERAFLETWDTVGARTALRDDKGLAVCAWNTEGAALANRVDVRKVLIAMHDAISAVIVDADTVAIVIAQVPDRPESLDAMIRAAIAVAEPLRRSAGAAPFR
jgi:hypothetical protein